MDFLHQDEVIRRQLERKKVLDEELQRDKYTLEIMRYDITILEQSFPASELNRLIEEIQKLRDDCNNLSEILDRAGVPALGDTRTTTISSSSISGMNAISISSSGQQISGGSSLSPRTQKSPRPQLPSALRTVTSPQRSTLMPPLYPNIPTFNIQPQTSSYQLRNDDNSDAENTQSWTCSACTFHNHPLLNKCEQCEQPRIPSGTVQDRCTRERVAKLEFQQHANNTNTNVDDIPSNNNEYYQIETDDTHYESMVPQYAPAYPYTNLHYYIHTENPNNLNLLNNLTNNNERTVNSSASIDDLLQTREINPSRTEFVKGHRHTPSM